MIIKHTTFPEKARVLDIGTGGGLPGIPLKIARPDIKITLVDSIRKKTKMVELFAQHTQLKDIDVVCDRVENLATAGHYANGFDVIVSRAVARTTELITWSKPLAKPNTFWAFLKGGDLTDELEEAQQAFPSLSVAQASLSAFGIPSFTEDEKKIITCRFS
jgi:16S rRNA (guanine527-N7)-methyltransferase